jgi:hypothetical protein
VRRDEAPETFTVDDKLVKREARDKNMTLGARVNSQDAGLYIHVNLRVFEEMFLIIFEDNPDSTLHLTAPLRA